MPHLDALKDLGLGLQHPDLGEHGIVKFQHILHGGQDLLPVGLQPGAAELFIQSCLGKASFIFIKNFQGFYDFCLIVHIFLLNLRNNRR